ncbi:MAG: DUF359 domain-containing protein [Candidatus Lokiarchaeota archaeon]|nr:DUF359 domain-containing protein [Candidatus Lokiarchaeota archaeon]MBD3199091.1 DUF359 domain-containing protein [Candidatus Lokiarchaeota archaeon]
MNDLQIPPEKRHLFSQPLDTLISGSRDETIPILEKKFKKLKESDTNFSFYIVGDIVTKDFLENLFLRKYVKLCIIDGKTQRAEIDINTEDYFDDIIEFENPKGSISEEVWELFQQIINLDKRVLINVISGEEDLLVLPLILRLTLNINEKKFIFYGQPPITDSKNSIPEGVVMVELTKKIQKTVKRFIKIMNKMEK